MDPFRLSAIVTHADGSQSRWSEDELDPENQPAQLTFSTQNPGGFGPASLTLPRGLNPGPDEALIDDVKLIGAGGRVAYEGRVHRLPRQQGDTRGVTVGMVGWSSHLSDHRAFREIYRDTTVGAWNGSGLARQVNLLASSYTAADPVTDHAAVITRFSGKWASAAKPRADAWYGKAIPIGSLYYSWEKNTNVVNADTSWHWQAFLSNDDTASSFDQTAELRAAGPGSGTLTASTTGRYFALLSHWYDAGPAGNDNADYDIIWTAAVYGTHGLTLRGTEPDAGFYASDVIQDVITRAAPKLRIGTLEDCGYVIPQLAFLEPTTPESVVLEANKTGLYDWFVWEDRTFTIQNPDPTRLTWQARLSDGAEPSLEGDDVVSLASSAYVYFTDVDGRDRVYGPTGAEFCDYTSDDLLGAGYDPYTDHGIDAPITFKLSVPCTPGTALQIGRVWLAEQNAPTRSGQIKLSGLVEHPTEGKVPSWRVRAGDYIQIMDRVGDTPRKIVATTYTHADRTVTCTMQDGPLFRVDGLLARLGVEVGILG